MNSRLLVFNSKSCIDQNLKTCTEKNIFCSVGIKQHNKPKRNILQLGVPHGGQGLCTVGNFGRRSQRADPGLGRVKQARRESQYKAGFSSWDSVSLALLGIFAESPWICPSGGTQGEYLSTSAHLRLVKCYNRRPGPCYSCHPSLFFSLCPQTYLPK